MRRTLAILGGLLVACVLVPGRPDSAWTALSSFAPGPEALRDVNSDGTPDAARMIGRVVEVAVSGPGRQTIELRHHTPVVSFAIVDVDGDRDDDILTLTQAGNVRIWRNDGQGQFLPERLIPRSRSFRSIPAQVANGPGFGFDLLAEGPGPRHQPVVLAALTAPAPPVRAGPRAAALANAHPVSTSLSSIAPRAPPAFFRI